MHHDDFGGLHRDLLSNDACARIPEETAGPFPGDGSNGPNVLSQAGVVRSDTLAGGLTAALTVAV